MPELFELFSDQAPATPLFATEKAYAEFRESFERDMLKSQEKWGEARRKSEQEARQRLLR